MDRTTEAWLEALERRHLADFTMSEVARALRALSSCYVERRGKLADGGALSSAGKRAAFALFYGPQHFLRRAEDRGLAAGGRLSRKRARQLGRSRVRDWGGRRGLGTSGRRCLRFGASIVTPGRSRRPAGPTASSSCAGAPHAETSAGLTSRRRVTKAKAALRHRAVLAAYAVNELAPAGRAALLSSLLDAHAQALASSSSSRSRGARCRGGPSGRRRSERAGGRADEWRFPADLPPATRHLARAAGLDPRELTARSLLV